jgi:hypothetical protein
MGLSHHRNWLFSLLAAALQYTVTASSIAGYNCVHDDLISHNILPVKAHQNYPEGRRLQLSSSSWKPIRIKPIYGVGVTSTATNMDAYKVSFLKNKLIPTAIDAWSNMLSVQPVVDKLYAGRTCKYVYSDKRCKEFEAETTCSDGTGAPIDLAPYFGEESYFTQSSNTLTEVKLLAGTSSDNINTDYILFITAEQTASCPSSPNSPGTLAYALSCQTDQHGRPLIGRANFCPLAIKNDTTSWTSQLTVALHEINHALGFSSNNFADWINSDLTAKSVENVKYFKYLDGSGNEQPSAGYLPSSSVINFFEERGMSKCDPSALSSSSGSRTRWTLSNCVHKVVTPRTVEAARLHFKCPTLNGAELENHLTTASSLLGSHWEQRIFNNELMGSYVQYVGRVSAVTLALHEDSGWYKANYSGTPEGWRKGDWGFEQGCAFATEKCVSNGIAVSTNPPHFSGINKTLVSLPDSMGLGYSTSKFYYYIPPQYRYWSDENIAGSPGTMADYCPITQMYALSQCAVGSAFVTNSVFLSGGACQAYACTSLTSLTVTLTTGESTSTSAVCTTANAGKSLSIPGLASENFVCLDPAVLCADRVRILLDSDINSASLSSPSPSPSPITTKYSKVSATIVISGLSLSQYNANQAAVTSNLKSGFAAALSILESQISIDRVYSSITARILQSGTSKLSVEFSVRVPSTGVSSMKTLVVSQLSSASTLSTAISTMLSSIASAVNAPSGSLSTSVSASSVTVTDDTNTSANDVDTTAIIIGVVSVAIFICCCVAIACVCGKAIKAMSCCGAKQTRVIPAQVDLQPPQYPVLHQFQQNHHHQPQYPHIQVQQQFQQPQPPVYYSQPNGPVYSTQQQTSSYPPGAPVYYSQPRPGVIYKETV